MVIDVTKRPKISLSKVVLEKSGDSTKINLGKNDEQIVINLNWSQNPYKTEGFFANIFGKNNAIDLDLGCYYELNDGHCSVIDGVQFSHGRGGAKNQQTAQGCYTDAPWIWHCGDDRSGSNQSGENILVNLKNVSYIRRIIVYCFIYEGVAQWQDCDAVLTIKIPNQPEVVVEMGKQTDKRNFCAIASIEFDGQSMSVKKEITFHKGHAECDQYYGWGFSWGKGSK